MVAAAPPAYLLSRHAHVCVTGDTIVMLDEMTGKYLSINRPAAAGLGSLILGWPMLSDDGSPPPVLQSLIARCLITQDPKQGKAATPPKVQLPTAWLQDHQPRGCPRMTVSELGRF